MGRSVVSALDTRIAPYSNPFGGTDTNVLYARHVVSALVEEVKRSPYAMATWTSSADDLASIDLD